MTEVVLSSLRKAFGTFVAVDGLDLTIESGEFVSLLGPSGCGKTTTLRMLAGLDFPTSGAIRFGERVVNDVPPAKRNVAMVFQSYALYPHMSVRRNIEYPLRKRRVAKQDRADAVRRAAEMLQLSELLDRKPKQLSGGQQQRVALGRALVRDPDIFLLDEPLSNLDAKLRAHMRAELVELHRRLGRTLVYVTHDQLEAMTMSHRIAVMEGGRLQQFATPDEVYNRPANRFVAGFIGTPSMNLIAGEVSGRDGRVEGFAAAGLGLALEPDRFEPFGGPAVLGVRPEHVALERGDIEAEVRVVEPTGHENIVIVELAGGTQVTARVQATMRPAVGETIRIGLDAGALHLFAAEAPGRRLNLDAATSASPTGLRSREQSVSLAGALSR